MTGYRYLIAGFSLAWTMIFASAAHAGSFTKTAAAGQTIHISYYYTWLPNCVPVTGTVTVRSKPQHGKLSNRIGHTTIQASRVVGVDHCFGRPIKAFQVLYTPAPGFHGVDTFVLDLRFRRLDDTDTYTVYVQ